VAVAAQTLTQRIDQFLNIGGSGLGQGAGVLAAQNLGAKQPERAAKSMWYGILVCTIFMSCVSILIFLFGRNIVALFNNESELVALGNIFLRIQIISYMVFGFTIVLQQCFNGIGDTLATMLVVLFSMFVVQTPLAFLLTNYSGLGVYGARWAIVAGTVVMAGIYGTYFRLGRWKLRKI
jgi:Na+-driven multidrug efflux pump